MSGGDTLGLDQLEQTPDRPADTGRRQVRRWAGFHESQPALQPRGRLGPCAHCRSGDHDMCPGVGCYGCPRDNHRRSGVAGLSDGLQGGTSSGGKGPRR